MGTLILGLVVVSLSVLVTVVSYMAVERRWASDLRKQHNEVAGFIYAILGLVYGVLIAYVVVVVWQNFHTAQLTTQLEANAVADLYALAEDLPAGAGVLLKDLARAYAQSVVEDEWPLLGHGEASPRSTALASSLGRAVRALDPQNAREQLIVEHAVVVHQSLLDNRRLRLFQSRTGIQPILWIILISGGILTVAFAYLFGVSSTRSHALMVAALAATIAGILYMIEATDYAYSGDIRVPPTPFEQVLATIGGP